MSYFLAGPIARIGQRLPGRGWRKVRPIDYRARRPQPGAQPAPREEGPIECLPAAAAAPPPLVVDLDGTLLKSDSLVEAFVALLGTRPLRALSALAALRHGKAA